LTLAVPSSGLAGNEPLTGPLAGYESQPDTGVTSLRAGYVVPKVTCSPVANAFMEQSLQIDGNDGGNGGFNIQQSCSNGVLFTFVDTYVGGAFEPATYSVSPGDKVGALITDTPAGNITVESEDLTSHKVSIQTGTQPAEVYRAWAATFNNVPQQPMPTITRPIPFVMTVNGDPLSAEAPQPYDMYNGSDLMMSTSAITATGKEFTNTFVASE
jgi:plastocyanin